MITVKNLLETKGTDICSVAPGSSVYDALKIMAEKHIGAVLVVENDKLLGVFSERDYARKIILHGHSSIESKIQDFMTKEVISVTPEKNIFECMTLFSNKHIRHLPVVENEKVIGIISIGDVVNSIISKQEKVIQDLEKYIYGG